MRRPLPRRHVGASPLAQSLYSARHVGQRGPVTPPPDPYNYEPDAAFQRQLALIRQGTANAESSDLAARKQLAIDYGDTGIAPDASSAQAAGQNPFSRFALLAREEQTRPRELTQQLNNQNLFYSSTYGQRQSELARALLQARAGAQSEERARLGELGQTLLQARSTAASQEEQAREDAAARLRQQIGDLPVRSFSPPPRVPVRRAAPGSPLVQMVASRLRRPPVRRPLPPHRQGVAP